MISSLERVVFTGGFDPSASIMAVSYFALEATLKISVNALQAD